MKETWVLVSLLYELGMVVHPSTQEMEAGDQKVT